MTAEKIVACIHCRENVYKMIVTRIQCTHVIELAYNDDIDSSIRCL